MTDAVHDTVTIELTRRQYDLLQDTLMKAGTLCYEHGHIIPYQGALHCQVTLTRLAKVST